MRQKDEFDQRERIIRVEEELKHQRELMMEGFNRMDKRFEQLTSRIDRFMLWSFATTISVGGLVVAFIKLT